MPPTRSFALVFLLFAVSSSARSRELATRSDAIINGEECAREVDPATVAVLTDGEVNFVGYQHKIKTVSCTGTLIAPDVVLTAAHCVDMSLYKGGVGTVRGEAYAVSFEPDLVALSEEKTTEFPEDAIYAARWVPHPKYSITAMSKRTGLSDNYDIALIFLKQPVVDVQPALLVTAEEASQLREGREVDISGWGMTRWEASPPQGSVGRKVCATSFVAELGDTEMQIGLGPDTARKCHGDSGGPSYLNVDTPHDVKRRVVGVTSHTYGEGGCHVGGVDTRVDAFLPWIEKELVKGCANRRRSWCGVPGLITPDHFDDGGTLPWDDGSGGDAPGCGCGQGASAGVLALVVVLWTTRRFAA